MAPAQDRRKNTNGNGKSDPTFNVLELVEAASKRTDDIANLRASYEEKMNDLKEKYMMRLFDAESKRVDANRAFDTAAVNTAYERASQVAASLAIQLSNSTDNFRALLATSAEQFAVQQRQLQEALVARILILEKAQYVGTGKAEVTDPLLHQIFEEVKIIKETNERDSGKNMGASNMWGYIIGGIGALLALSSLITMIVHILTTSSIK